LITTAARARFFRKEADDQGRLYRVAAGDAIVINGVEFTVTVNTSGYAKLTKGAS
jgi:hypothetical protein